MPEQIHVRSGYRPMSDDPNVRRRINNELDKKANIPVKISTEYPERGNDIYLKVQSILSINKVKPVVTAPSVLMNQEYIDDMLVVLCSFGSSPARLNASKAGFDLLRTMNPLPKIVVCEGSIDGSWNFEYVKKYSRVSYIPVDMQDAQYANFFAKECLWNHAANTMLDADKTITKLVFLDMDCFFVDRYGFAAINDAFTRYDIMSPHQACYYTGANMEATHYGLLNSIGYYVANNSSKSGYQGFSIAITVDAYSAYFNRDLPNPSLGMGDLFFWWMLTGTRQMKHFRMLPYREEACLKYLITGTPRVGYANQIIGHVDHGKVDDRIYKVRSELMKICCPEPFCEVAQIGDTHLRGWASNPASDDLRYMYERIRIENRREIKITSYEDTKQYYDWVHGLAPNPPACIGPNRFTKTGNKMPLSECAVPVMTAKHIPF